MHMQSRISHCKFIANLRRHELQAQLCIPSTPRAGAVPAEGMQERNEALIGWQILVGDGDACGAARTPMWDMARSLAPELRDSNPVLWQDAGNKVKLFSEA